MTKSSIQKIAIFCTVIGVANGASAACLDFSSFPLGAYTGGTTQLGDGISVSMIPVPYFDANGVSESSTPQVEQSQCSDPDHGMNMGNGGMLFTVFGNFEKVSDVKFQTCIPSDTANVTTDLQMPFDEIPNFSAPNQFSLTNSSGEKISVKLDVFGPTQQEVLVEAENADLRQVILSSMDWHLHSVCFGYE